ncbi:ImmA/IrrE family metallo-endopeptidase [Nonomuraea sp. NN258]|uniref:ImmA/IrrE family metallo-endopeptidase n=1 Tax=Nonomuraea antri TaxID=2730852 RepID=UPI001569A25A|nr:ImmA/IrrE family metallo-endopeptidase [Nonomuraea antri]NRQ30618.1 ImmA/IrrE family metallo-endopeptidase [Nonomuraea antri]
MATQYRRGFKTEANDIAREVRAELGIRTVDRLDPHQLAAHLAIPIIPLSDFEADAPLAHTQFGSKETFAFSAVTVFYGSQRTVVHNDFQPLGRQANNITHEASHGLLHHPPTPAIDDRGCRNWRKDIEDEAAWLAGVLLIPEETALYIARQQWPMEQAAERFGVSVDLLRWRLNKTGAYNRVNRGRGFAKRL